MKSNDRMIIEITATFYGGLAMSAVFEYFHFIYANQIAFVLTVAAVILAVYFIWRRMRKA